jgi:taurine transport system permease protein
VSATPAPPPVTGWAPRYAGALGWRTHAVIMCSALLAVGALWEVVAAVRLFPSNSVPSPSAVWHAGRYLWTHAYGTATLPEQALISTIRVAVGCAIAVAAGVTVGVGVALVAPVRYVLEPYLWFLRPIPAFAFVTVLITWFGIGELPKILLVAIAGFTPMTVYAMTAMAAIPPDLEETARTLGAGRLQLFIHVRLKAALPDILTGIRIMIPLAWTSVMGAELIGATSGLGWLIWNGMRLEETPIVFAGVISIGVIGAAMEVAAASVAWLLVGKWAPQMRGQS